MTRWTTVPSAYSEPMSAARVMLDLHNRINSRWPRNCGRFVLRHTWFVEGTAPVVLNDVHAGTGRGGVYTSPS
jgi:hypothetical protein